jgi:hypothetical protein
VRVEVNSWSTFQHFKDRDPIWLKLYRELRHKREWRRLPGDEAKFLVDLWMLASEQPTPGVIDLPLEDIAWEFRPDEDEVQKWLYTLAGNGFITVISETEQAAIPRALARGRERDREETETETTAPAAPAEGVENSGAQTTERPTYTRAVLQEAARKLLGLGRLPGNEDAANGRILNDWLYAGSGKRRPEDIMAAIEGAADMRDRDLVGWDSAKPGTPMTLKALMSAMTLDHTGDGAPRLLWDVALEHQRRREEASLARTPTPNVKGSPMTRLKATLPDTGGTHERRAAG